jgi:hypothetical protein
LEEDLLTGLTGFLPKKEKFNGKRHNRKRDRIDNITERIIPGKFYILFCEP